MANKYIQFKDGGDNLYPQTEGKVILSTNEASGKVLTSDGNGNAIWTIGGSGIGYDEFFFIKPTISNGVIASNDNPQTISANESIKLIYSVPTGFSLPSQVVVNGATGTWNSETGVLTLTNATGDVSFAIQGVQDVDYFYLEAVNDGAVGLFQELPAFFQQTPQIYYYIDGTQDWQLYTFGVHINLKAGQKVFFKGDNASFSISIASYIHVSSTDTINAGGNVMSLLDSSCESTTIPTNYCFAGLFYGCNGLLKCPKLPATTLKEGCYYNMFYNCNSLVYVPDLPSTETLPTDCYHSMFANCTSLVINDASATGYTQQWKIPKAGYFTAQQSQSSMFYNCAGTRASADLSIQAFAYATYYVENAPIS